MVIRSGPKRRRLSLEGDRDPILKRLFGFLFKRNPPKRNGMVIRSGPRPRPRKAHRTSEPIGIPPEILEKCRERLNNPLMKENN